MDILLLWKIRSSAIIGPINYVLESTKWLPPLEVTFTRPLTTVLTIPYCSLRLSLSVRCHQSSRTHSSLIGVLPAWPLSDLRPLSLELDVLWTLIPASPFPFCGSFWTSSENWE